MKRKKIALVTLLLAIIVFSCIALADTYVKVLPDYNGGTVTLTTDLTTRELQSTLSYTKSATLSINASIMCNFVFDPESVFLYTPSGNPIVFSAPTGERIRDVDLVGVVNGVEAIKASYTSN